MIRYVIVLLALCVSVALLAPAHAATSRMPYGSFLTRPVTDAHDFARLLRQDMVVAQRFADHFGMSNDALADYIEKHGRVKGLSQSHHYLEYFIDKRGQVHKHHKWLRPKHRVLFVNGTPVLDMECGNPMTRSLPKLPEQPRPAPRVTQAPPPPAPQDRPPAPLPPVPPPPPVEAPPEAPPPPEVEIVEEPREIPVPPAAEIVPPSPVEAAPPSRRRMSPLLPILIGVGIGAAVGDGRDDRPPPPPGPVIPESSTLALGASGLGAVLLWRRMRKSGS